MKLYPRKSCNDKILFSKFTLLHHNEVIGRIGDQFPQLKQFWLVPDWEYEEYKDKKNYYFAHFEFDAIALH